MTPLRATVRLQFHPEFTLDDALLLLDYFADLGISHIYASPLLTAKPGSTHGYDVIDPTQIDPELGGESAFDRLVSGLRARNMGLILDIVPNHMAVTHLNPWWRSVLEWGRVSPYAEFFDIQWDSPNPLLNGRVLLPILATDYAAELDAGELKVVLDKQAGQFRLHYFDHRVPLTPPSYGDILQHTQDARLNDLGIRFDALEDAVDPFSQASALCLELAALCQEGPTNDLIHSALAHFNPEPQEAGERHDRFHQMLERQHYRLANWRTANDEINWRRFFDINELISLRAERGDVFEASHAKVFQLISDGKVDGLRIDHIDGLANPRAYCRRLRRRVEQICAPDLIPFPIHVEKILGAGEVLEPQWGADGTTGYEFMNQVSLLQHDPMGGHPLQTHWHRLTGRPANFMREVEQARRLVLTHSLASDFDSVSDNLLQIARADLATRDITLNAIRRGLLELVAHFPVYRTYAVATGRSQADEAVFQQALQGAKNSLPEADSALLEQLNAWLGAEPLAQLPPGPYRSLRQRTLTRFHQLTAPAAAKAVEDTAFYRYGALLSRNDVGFDPQHFASSIEAFHAFNVARALACPNTLLATATHDHKRGEDTRARLAVVSERSAWYAEKTCQWRNLAAPLRSQMAEEQAPSPADELMLFQSILASWPLDLNLGDNAQRQDYAQRLQGWQEKALREAKLHSGWTAPNSAYEEACQQYLHGLFEQPDAAPLRASLAKAAAELAPAGALNSLAQCLLKLCCPGVPDIYQGTEFWDFSLVDPDNRRPVDYAARIGALAEPVSERELLIHWRDGRIKQYLIARTLQQRKADPQLFSSGSYLPLEMEGAQKHQALAFLREYQGRLLLVLVPRLASDLVARQAFPQVAVERWGDTRIQMPGHLKDRTWTSVLGPNQQHPGQETLAVGTLLAHFPVALFTSS
ncbi:malto-oligosyltrehalose synthase [Halopseudomonas sp.]|jgi:(1->4)-alpha-D-glucan 1-alpha-D-glucosylmutase|uniref:malto-oligosyltrehalose synthase n=1 Tax=Halopseudomonas sp. TaxID=2901191 RepID=UPI0039E36293